MKKTLSHLVVTTILIAIFVGGLKAVDAFIHSQLTHGPLARVNQPGRMNQMIAYDMYPFDGGHPQPNFDLIGNGQFRSGDHGFMVDFDIGVEGRIEN